MKKPVVNYEECIGCGSCVEVCPEVFEMRDDSKAYVIAENKCNTSNCEEAANICPVEAITFEE